MAKYLRQLSDSHWEKGMEMLKKHFSRGGNTTFFDNYNFQVTGKLKVSYL